MAIMAKEQGSRDYPSPPTGMTPAICVDVVDLGVVKTPFKDDKTGADKYNHQIFVLWQLHPMTEDDKLILREDGKPFRIGKFYTLSLNEKANLRKDLESWRGKPFTDAELADGFDVEKLILVPCQLNLIEKVKQGGKKDVVVSSVAPKHRADPTITVDPEFRRQMDIPGGRDTRSPKQDGSASTMATESDPFGTDADDDSLDLPF